MRSTFALILGTMAAWAQTAPPASPPEIRGTVVEGGTNVPIANAEITISILDGYRLKEVTKAITDASGSFRVRMDKLHEYFVRAGKPGYTYDGKNPMRHTPSNQAHVKLDKEHSSAEARFVLFRAGELTGHVVDAETGKPIANLRVYPITLLYAHGRPAQIAHKPAVTDSEGQFVATGLQPGRYLVEMRPQALEKEQFLVKFSADDLKAVDSDYQRSYWPGGGGFDMALPVWVLPGDSSSVGTIKARKGPFYRIHLSIAADNCAPGEKVNINATMLWFIGSSGSGEGECGKDYLLRNFEPGPYSLYVLSGKTQEDRKRIILPVEVTDKNLDLTIPLGRGVDIHGRIVVAEGARKPELENIKIRIIVTGDIQFADEWPPASPDSEGRFHFVNRPIARVRISVLDLPANFDVKEIRYNGSVATDNIVALNGNAPVQSLEVIVDDKPALIRGTVVDGDKTVGHAHVVLLKWPVSIEDVFLSAKRAEADDDGKFLFAGLAPGEYRILAVMAETADLLDEPHVLERLLSGAETVTLSASDAQNQTLRVTDPGR
jgi:hypothetical protein